MAGYRDVFDLVEQAHAKDSPLAAHVKGSQTIEVDLIDRQVNKVDCESNKMQSGRCYLRHRAFEK